VCIFVQKIAVMPIWWIN